MRRGIKRVLSETLMRCVPPLLYFRIADALMPAFYPARAGGPARKVEWIDGAYRIDWGEGTAFWFSHPIRYRRYAWPTGARRVMERMLRKYQDGDVRLRDGDVVVEAGANVGEFTCAAAATAREIHAFEPDSVALIALRRNVAALSNVVLHSVGLGNATLTMPFYLSSADADSSVVEPDLYTGIREIQLVSVADFMAAQKLAKIDFLKVEAEGYEPEILEGCVSRLGDIERIAVDCSPEREGRSPVEACEAILKPAGFETWRREAADGLPLMLFAIRREKR